MKEEEEPVQRFAVTIDYPPELSLGEVREWIAKTLAGVTAGQRLMVESVGSHCYGYILKGYIELEEPCTLDEQDLISHLEASPGRGPKLTSLRLL